MHANFCNLHLLHPGDAIVFWQGFGIVSQHQLINKLLTFKFNFMSAQKILIGALSGLVAGVAIGLLTAPASGSDTRQKIADSADELKRKLRRLRGQAADEL